MVSFQSGIQEKEWCHPSAQTLGSSFLYKFTKSVSFYNIKPILTKSNALLAIKFPGSQWALLHRSSDSR
ncbi:MULTISPECIES: hypothetical protein [unclassified Wolbachia]|uniref:hypothetical protein n=1 Tax=unclassified Wolbachia TaxID=2640676 RepID=UPI0030D39826